MSTTRVIAGFALAALLLGPPGAGPRPAVAAEGGSAVHAAHNTGHGTAQEAPEGSGTEEVSTNPLEFQTDLAIWTAVVFVVLLVVLWKFAWRPVVQGLDKRERNIADNIAQAEQANREAQELLAQYERRLADAQDEVRVILERGRRDAERMSQEIVDKARQDAVAERDRALRQIDAATSAALKDLADQSAALAVELAGKIVGARLRPEDHAALIERTLADFASHPPSNN